MVDRPSPPHPYSFLLNTHEQTHTHAHMDEHAQCLSSLTTGSTISVQWSLTRTWVRYDPCEIDTETIINTVEFTPPHFTICLRCKKKMHWTTCIKNDLRFSFEVCELIWNARYIVNVCACTYYFNITVLKIVKKEVRIHSFTSTSIVYRLW